MALPLYYAVLHTNSKIKLFSTCTTLNNHYNILNLPRNCSPKEIRESFIKLSKENHPDVNKDKNAHKKFLQINEAYNVLSKTETRRLYDLSLAPPEGYPPRNEIRVPYREHSNDPWKDPAFYINRNRMDDARYENEPYYGIKGVKRVSNLTVVIICLSLAIFVVGLQILAIRNSFTFKRDQLIKRSNDAQESLNQMREVAAINGNKMQLEILRHRFTESTKCSDET